MPAVVPHLTLNNGVEIPQLGFGVFQVEPSRTAEVVLDAFEAGYRHVDTAQMYKNEAGVGEALARSGLDRSDVFITSKLSNASHDPRAAHDAFERSIDALGTPYVDLFLIHWPMPKVGDFVETWQALEALYGTGRIRAIGVSNFTEQHLRRLAETSAVTPAVNQIEVHPYLSQNPLRAYGREHGIVTEAWSPIAQGKVLSDPELVRIGGEHGRTPAQVALRWHLQRGDVVFPKTTHRERMAENLALFDFELADDEMAAIEALDRGLRTGAHPDEFNWVPED
ncbi:MAG: oxidoreductase [Cellulomonas sp. 73-145]|uniref:aldo/keto reductase n=1 Tax=Cellulomonas sp. 73-145 TaxID=1895739 RepID=UPI00092B1FD1|nr:aldo/keto reductase [Cellulomonas sp. 73-145]OJV58770.1 MAG: oxidoreductase [Cellulomonas sp. 73-145]